MLKRYGGGILLFTILTNLNAIELSTIIPNCSTNCEITTNYDIITNNGTFIENKDGIRFKARITEFINYGNITKTNGGKQSFGFESSGYVARFINYGTIDSSFWIANSAPGLDAFTNYGVLKGGISNEVSNTMIINNLGSMGWWDSKGNINNNNGKVLIANYALMLNENATEFNKFNGSGDKNSHLVISGSGVTFKNANSKIILGFGEKFQEGEGYLISKLATDTGGSAYSDLGVDFSRLIPRSDIYYLKQQGNSFIVYRNAGYSAVGSLYKSNIRTMNNFYTMSNSMIYPRKLYNLQNLGRTHSLLQYSPLQHSPSLAEGARGWVEYSSLQDSAIPLKSYESFAYRNESVNRRIQRQNKRNYNRKSQNQVQNLKENQRNLQNLNTDSANKNNQNNSSLRASERERGTSQTQNNSQTQRNSQNLNADSTNKTNQNNSSLRASISERGNPQESLDSAISLKSYESFAYRNESINRRIQRQNKRNYSRNLNKSQNQTQNLKENQRNSQNLNADFANETNKNNLRDSAKYSNSIHLTQNLKENQRNSQNLTQNPNNSQTPHNYYFILTPFFNYNSFAQSGNYNLSGFDYGFLTAFSTQVAESNSLGAHFIFSYGSLGDSKDKDLSIKSLNLNVGINYKLDLVYDMYLKARGDFYYFSNALDSLTIKNIKPNNLGFGASVIFGKDFDFGKGGVLGLEVGIDYKALKTNEVSLNSQTYKQSLLNLIYADVGLNYNKYFGGFGINLGSGFKANLAPKLAESTLLLNSQTLKFTLDNDKYLAYANAGISYLLNHKNFDMEFSLAYYGNFGDRVISNGGGVEWRVVW